MNIIECEQGSQEWVKARLGVPSASGFSKIITPAKGALSKSATDYVFELIQEVKLGKAEELFKTKAILEGIRLEPQARAFYSILQDADVEEVGFVKSECGNFGCSPDGLIDDRKGGLEIKCPTLKTHLKYLYNGTLPSEYKLQVHGSMWVTGLDYWDFMSYSEVEGIEPLLIRIERDEFTESLGKAFAEFTELRKTIESKVL